MILSTLNKFIGCLSFFRSIQDFCPFLIGLFALLFICWSFLKNMTMSPLPGVCITNIVPSVWLVYSFSYWWLLMGRLFYFDEYNLSLLLVWLILFCPVWGIYACSNTVKIFSQIFIQRFYSGFIFMSII